jgi:hypothetical protein
VANNLPPVIAFEDMQVELEEGMGTMDMEHKEVFHTEVEHMEEGHMEVPGKKINLHLQQMEAAHTEVPGKKLEFQFGKLEVDYMKEVDT